MSSRADIVVIGAGPAGAVAALEAAKAGLGKVMLFDKAGIGRGKTCGGGISPGARKTFRQLGLWERIEPCTYPIDGLRLVSRSGLEMNISGGETACVLNRSRLDRILVDAAVEAGVTFEPYKQVQELVYRGEQAVGVRLAQETVAARWIIMAGGALPGRRLSFQKTGFLSACLARFENLPFTPHRIEMIYDRELPRGYGWLFPESDSLANIGICLAARQQPGRSTRQAFESFLQRYFGDRLARATRIGQLRGHPISASAWIRHAAPPGVLVVGEAGGLVNPATGEGIIYALQSARLAVRALNTAERKQLDARRTAALYLASLRRTFGARLLTAELFARLGARAIDAAARLGGFSPVRRLCAMTMSRL